MKLTAKQIEVLREIQEYCEKGEDHEYCSSCPFWITWTNRDKCMFDVSPDMWDLDKLEDE